MFLFEKNNEAGHSMINSFQKALLSLGPQKSGQKYTFFKRKKKKSCAFHELIAPPASAS